MFPTAPLFIPGAQPQRRAFGGASAGIALVANTASGTNSGGTTTSAIDTTGANLIVIHVGYFNAPTITDSKGNTWTALTARDPGISAGRMYYCLNPTVGSGHTFTASGVNSFGTIAVSAFSGVSAFGSENGAAGNAASIATGAVVPSVDGSLVISGITFNTVGSSVSVNASLSILNQVAPVNSANFGVALAYLIQGTAASINPTWTPTTSQELGATIATFTPA